jgi:hypothetical protein
MADLHARLDVTQDGGEDDSSEDDSGEDDGAGDES